jgi:hypothetical protein
MKNIFLFLTGLFILQNGFCQNIGINLTGAAADSSAMIDISSTVRGLLIPRMTALQRDSIIRPANGLQVYNTTNNTIDIYQNTRWGHINSAHIAANIVYVDSLADLPAPSGGSITLDGSKMYIFSGFVNISPNYLNLNGASLRGNDPSRDGVMSSVSGGILRSTNVSVFMENFAVIPLSAVVEVGIPSLGVGQVSGFNAITISKNYWSCKDGVKVTGTVGKFASSYNFITNITAGFGIEFLSGLTINDIDLSNNYFIYNGQTGVKVNAGATIDRGRVITNMFRGVGTYFTGFDSYSLSWQMISNTNIPNSRSFCFVYMNNNATATSLPVVGTYYKIAGTTTVQKQQKFVATNNRLTYLGKESLTSKIIAIIGGKAPANNSDFSIAIAKNGVIVPFPNGSISPGTNNQSFQISLITEIDLQTNDYIEIFIKTNNNNVNSLVVENLQFRVND